MSDRAPLARRQEDGRGSRMVGGVVAQQRRRDTAGVEGEGGDGKRSDRRLRGYLDELLGAHYLNPWPGVVARPATTPFVRQVMTGGRESFTEESRYRGEHLAFFHPARFTYALQNLSNDRGNNRGGLITRNEGANLGGIPVDTRAEILAKWKVEIRWIILLIVYDNAGSG